MPFIGQQPTTGAFLELDSLTASATDEYDLQLNGAYYYPESVNNLLVSINGVIQGSSTMSLSGYTLTVGATLSSSDVIDFVRVFGNVGTISTPTDGSVTANKIGTGAVTNAKIADSTIDLTSKVTGILPVANGGTGQSTSDNVEVFNYGLVSGNQSIPAGGWHLAQMSVANISNTNYDTSTYKYTVPTGKDGIYIFSLQASWLTAGDYNDFLVSLYKNGVKLRQHGIRQEHYENGNLTTIENVSAGDYFQMYVAQGSGTSISLRTDTNSCWFSGTRIGG